MISPPRRWWMTLICVTVLATPATLAVASDAAKPTQTEPPPDAITEQAVQIAREIVASFADVEKEQQALLRELGEADRRLAEEKARADRLEQEVARLLGQPAAPTALALPAAPDEQAEPPRPPRLAVPPREVNALGIVESNSVELAQAPAGVDALRWTPLAGTVPTDGAMRVVVEAGETRFEHHDALMGSTPLATLALRDGVVQWRWANVPSSSSQASLARLPWVLAGSTLEALSQGRVVMRWHFEPLTQVVPLRSGRAVAPAPPFGDAAPLILEPDGRQPGWVLDAHTPTVVRALSPAAVLTVEWRASTGEVVIHSRMGEGLGPHLEQQIAAWEKDLAEARLRNPDDRATIERISAVIAELRARKGGLEAAAVASPPGAAQPAYILQLVGDNGAVCARYVIQP